MFGWIELGPKWATEECFRVLETLKQSGIPCRMPSDDMFFFSPYHLPHPDRRWSVRVRRRDRQRAAAVLAREGLMDAPGEDGGIRAQEQGTSVCQTLVPSPVH